jgi:hypothetical protein
MSAFPVSRGRGIAWLFAFEYGKMRLADVKAPDISENWRIYDPVDEWIREGLFMSREDIVSSQQWRVSNVNESYGFCPSYPRLLLVPKTISDWSLSAVAGFRSKSRIPVLTWYDKETGGSIWRCSQPKVGVGKNCSEDEMLWSGVLSCSKRFVVFCY